MIMREFTAGRRACLKRLTRPPRLTGPAGRELQPGVARDWGGLLTAGGEQTSPPPANAAAFPVGPRPGMGPTLRGSQDVGMGLVVQADSATAQASKGAPGRSRRLMAWRAGVPDGVVPVGGA
jgi:hypothetical protein